LALGQLSDYASNAALGRALHDEDRGVRMLAEGAIGRLWCRVGTPQERKRLEKLVALNAARRFIEATSEATKAIDRAPHLAECWNQRAVALFAQGRYGESVRDCDRTLELNPYHFGAAAGMGQCYLKLNNRRAALECFRRALRLNPNLEGIRAHVLYLQRTLKSQE
jgi:tetratricopeptide (TPR) repeat protein